MKSISRLCAAIVSATLVATLCSSACAETQIERGKYLVGIIGCSDCHTPGGISSKPDPKRYLAGSDIDIDVAGLGVFTPPNITPEKTTGLGGWTNQQIVTAITTGVRPDGRILSPAMPWSDFSHLTKSDAVAIAVYLKSIPPVKNKVPGPAAPTPGPANYLESIVPRHR